MYAPPPRLNLLVIRYSDIDRAARFYQSLGLLITRHVHGGPQHYTSEVDGTVFEIYPATESHPASATRFGFAVDDVDALLPPLVELGSQVLKAPHDSPWGRRAVVRDLDGNTLELVNAT